MPSAAIATEVARSLFGDANMQLILSYRVKSTNKDVLIARNNSDIEQTTIRHLYLYLCRTVARFVIPSPVCCANCDGRPLFRIEHCFGQSRSVQVHSGTSPKSNWQAATLGIELLEVEDTDIKSTGCSGRVRKNNFCVLAAHCAIRPVRSREHLLGITDQSGCPHERRSEKQKQKGPKTQQRGCGYSHFENGFYQFICSRIDARSKRIGLEPAKRLIPLDSCAVLLNTHISAAIPTARMPIRG